MARCSSTVSPPPEKAYLLIFVLIALGVSLTKMLLVGTLALILPLSPCAGADRHLCQCSPHSNCAHQCLTCLQDTDDSEDRCGTSALHPLTFAEAMLLRNGAIRR